VRAAVASCHVERLLDDDVWTRFSALVRARPAGFRIAALVRPPDGEDEARWLERARTLDVPFGLHTHWTSPSHARPTDGNTAARVRRDLDWLAAHGLRPGYFSGGGWYTDDDVRAVVADAGLVDLTATTFPLPYGGGRVVAGPEKNLLPATHTIGMLARSVRLPGYVHVYFHDTDLADAKRALALRLGLRHLSLRRPVKDLDELSGASSR
jgi:peptidoglycan/xylan/chitin deacetylase (PgdA/CDA1 family)